MLHKPDGRDARLFQQILQHHRENVGAHLAPLAKHERTSEVQAVVDDAASVDTALMSLRDLAEEADSLVLSLDITLRDALQHECRESHDQLSSAVLEDSERSDSLELLAATVYRPAPSEKAGKVNPTFSKSFSVAEEELVSRTQARERMHADSDYVTDDKDGLILRKSRTAQEIDSSGLYSRNGRAPRVFGSFSQLESQVRKLQLDTIATPEIDPHEEPVKIRDFAETPDASRCASPSPTSYQLQRREALMSRDVEVQDRVINGEIVRSRRPSTRSRSQTINEHSGGLEAWLQSERSGPPATRTKVPQRGNLRHRENTI